MPPAPIGPTMSPPPAPTVAESGQGPPPLAPSDAPGKNPKKIKAVVGSVVALAGVALLVIVGLRFFGGGDDGGYSGGASSPEAALTGFVDAVNREDLLAAVSYLAPDEVSGVSVLVEDVLSYLDDIELDPLGEGDELTLSITVDGIRADEVADHVALLTFDAMVDGGSADAVGPLGLILPDTFDADEEFDRAVDEVADELELVAIELGGNWYLSPLLTFGHLVTDAANLPRGDFAVIGEDRAEGHDGPEAAVDALIDAINGRDVEDLASTLADGEARVALVYADALDDLLAEIPARIDWEVSARASDRDDDRVEIDEVTVVAADGENVVTVEVNGDCVTASDLADQPSRNCVLDDLPTDERIADDLTLLTTESDGTRLELIGSASELVSRFVGVFDRQSMLRALRLEVLDDAQPIAFGEDVAVDFGETDYAVFEYTVPAGERSYVTLAEDDDTDAYYDTFVGQPDGTWRYDWIEDEVSEQPVDVRLLVTSAVDRDDCSIVLCEPASTGTATVSLRSVGRQQVAFPTVLSGQLGPGERILLEVDVAATETTMLALSDGLRIEPDETWIDHGAGVWTVPGGPSELLVTNTTDEVVDFEIVPNSASAGFGGEVSVRRSIGSTLSEQLVLNAGTYTVTATPFDGQDIVLEVDVTDCRADEGLGDEPESCTMRADGVVVVEVEVYGYSDADEFGDVALEITQS